MTTLYVVFEHSPSGGVHVEEPVTGIFSSKELAEAEVKKRLGDDATPIDSDEHSTYFLAQPDLEVVIRNMTLDATV